MNIPNAFGFIGAGSIMEALHFLPGITGVRELWLLVMGGVLLTVGFSVIGRAAWHRLVSPFIELRRALAAERVEDGLRGEAAVRNRVAV